VKNSAFKKIMIALGVLFLITSSWLTNWIVKYSILSDDVGAVINYIIDGIMFSLIGAKCSERYIQFAQCGVIILYVSLSVAILGLVPVALNLTGINMEYPHGWGAIIVFSFIATVAWGLMFSYLGWLTKKHFG